jgi:hypothetical protein
LAGSAPAITTTAAAAERILLELELIQTQMTQNQRILVAAAVGLMFVFVQSNPKTGKSRERYEAYKAETAFAGLEAFNGVNFRGTTRPVLSGGVMTKGGNFANSVAHVFFYVRARGT